MRILLFFIITSLCTGLQAQDWNQVDDQGRKQGPWHKFHESSKGLFYEGQFKDDMPVGVFTYYYADGKKKAEMKYRDNGVVYNTTYHPQGGPMAQGKYVEKRKDSTWVYYDVKGLLTSKEQYDMGAKHGVEEVYYPNGQVSESTAHEEGLRNGPWLQYYETGQVKIDGAFKQDQIHGAISYYFLNGKKEVTGTYNEGLRTGTWMYYNENGSIKYQAVYRGGKKLKERFENGTFNDYGGDNVILSTTSYVKGKKEGEFFEYHDDAEFHLETVTDPRSGETYSQEVKSGNELKRKGTYLNDKLHGEVIHYSPNGRVIKTETYIEGILQ